MNEPMAIELSLPILYFKVAKQAKALDLELVEFGTGSILAMCSDAGGAATARCVH